jgi:hypothetical protein
MKGPEIPLVSAKSELSQAPGRAGECCQLKREARYSDVEKFYSGANSQRIQH